MQATMELVIPFSRLNVDSTDMLTRQQLTICLIHKAGNREGNGVADGKWMSSRA